MSKEAAHTNRQGNGNNPARAAVALRSCCAVLIAVALLAACSTDSHRFKLSGQLLNMNQGAFYVYDTDGTVNGIDTIQVSGGRFSYTIECERPTTLMIVFPNFSQQPIFAEPGKSVDISGDATRLKQMKVEGTKANEQMNCLREQLASSTPPQARKTAAQFIADHPDSPVGEYLVRTYFVNAVPPDLKEARRLVALMTPKQHDNGRLARLAQQLRGMAKVEVGARLPQFSATDMDGRAVSSDELSSGDAIILTWASWSYASTSMLRAVKDLRRTRPGLKVLSISIDGTQRDCRAALRFDTISWKNVCDGRLFDGNPVSILGMTAVPGNIVLKDGIVKARNLSSDELREYFK